MGNHRTQKNNQFRRKQHIVLWINNVLRHVWLLEASAETARHRSNTGRSPFTPWLTNITSVIPTCDTPCTRRDTATDAITDMRIAVGCDWCIASCYQLGINPIVLWVEWWFDGKHFSSLNHMKSNCTSYSSCLQRVRQATRLVSNSCGARRRLTQLTWRSW